MSSIYSSSVHLKYNDVLFLMWRGGGGKGGEKIEKKKPKISSKLRQYLILILTRTTTKLTSCNIDFQM